MNNRIGKPGKFIVFEGVEGSGKTTQIERSRQWLTHILGEDVPIVTTREPGGTDLGTKLRQLLLEEKQSWLADRTELLLYAADRAQHIEEFIKPHLQKGAIILCDRYTDSTLAYQGYGNGMPLELIHSLNQIATGGLESDLTLWLDLNVQTGLLRAQSRGVQNRIDKASLAFHLRVQQGFTELAKAYPHRIVRIDASGTEEDVQAQIQGSLMGQIQSFQS